MKLGSKAVNSVHVLPVPYGVGFQVCCDIHVCKSTVVILPTLWWRHTFVIFTVRWNVHFLIYAKRELGLKWNIHQSLWTSAMESWCDGNDTQKQLLNTVFVKGFCLWGDVEQRGLTIWHSSSYITVQIIMYTLKMDQNNFRAKVRVKIKVDPYFFFYHGMKPFQLERRHYMHDAG